MESSVLVGALALLTLLAVAVFALMSKKRTQERLEDDNAPKSTLAADAPDARN